MASDLERLLHSLNRDCDTPKPTALVGHSMGGKVVGQFLSDYETGRFGDVTLMPIHSATIVDIAMRPYPPTHGPIFDAVKSVPLEKVTTLADAAHYLEQARMGSAMVQFLTSNLSRETTGYRWLFNIRALERNYNAILSAPQLSSPRINTPVHLIYGSESNYIDKQDIGTMEQLFPHITTTPIQNAGHWVHAEQPKAFIDALMAHLI